MSEPLDKNSLLAAFDLGPKWAKTDEPEKKYDQHRGDEGDGKRGGRGGGQRGGGFGGGGQRGGGGFGGGQRGGGGFQGRRDDRRGGDRGRGQHGGRDQGQRDLPEPAPGVKVSLMPSKEAVHLVVKEIHHVARVYSLFDIAQILLGDRARYSLRITSDPKRPPMYRGKKDESLFLTREEAVAHFWQSGPVEEFYEKEEVETDPPKGNFQVVAKCGMSGEWLGPPNFHSYQSTLRRIHRERFSNMRFETYASRVRTERGEEAVNAWMETMKKRVRWRAKGADDDAWTFERSEVERDFLTKHFDRAFKETRDANLGGDVPALSLSLGIFAAVRIASSHARRHPAMLIPATCRSLESEHLAVFKRKGKLFSGPARPHPLSHDAVLAERPTAIVEWLEAHPESKLEALWKGVLPEGSTEAGKEWLVDLFWLLSQGHVLLFADDTLVLPTRRKSGGGGAKTGKPADAASPEEGKPKKKRRRRKSRGRKARFPSAAKLIRQVSQMSETRVMMLKGEGRIWRRRLEKRGRIESLEED